ncbi:secreted RxLR effector protein 161-like [Lathyrus oleraceus]|uniref:secreted RxLR effector protein 161-like n=1 Tax=Pisum sativum TaxID=3888 RepID=UPI0021CFF69C|nr:secreted RxLR effector protein 161-like [Pisum sativum]
MEDAKLIDNPMPTNSNLERNENGKDVDLNKYRGMIGYLLYLTAPKSDIMFSVCMCGHYQSTPKESHLEAIKRIRRYLHGTSKCGIWYSNGSDYNLVGYTDFDFSGFKSDRKRTGGTCHIFSNFLVSWHNKK